MSDWRKTQEAPEQDRPLETHDSKRPERGIRSAQGYEDVRDSSSETYADQKYVDAKGHHLTMRTHKPSDDQYHVRVYDDALRPEPPEHTTYGDAGRANLLLERDASGNVKRAKLQDIETIPSYRNAGTGSRMLAQCEDIARRNGASEIHGFLDREDERQWFQDHGYKFRESNKRELYRPV